MNMNEQTLKEFRADFASAVAQLEKNYNVKINLNNISYNDAGFHTKLEVKNMWGGKPIVDRNLEMRACRAVARKLFHCNEIHSDFDGGFIGAQWLTIKGEVITIVDFKTKNSRYPLIFTKAGHTGTFKGPIELLKGKYRNGN